MGCRQICLQELYLRGQWMAHASNSLCDIISYSTSNPIIPLSSLLPNLTSILHLTPPHPIISFPYVPSSHPPSTSPSFHHSHPSLNLPPSSFHSSPICPLLLILYLYFAPSSFLTLSSLNLSNQLHVLLQLNPTSDYFLYLNSTYMYIVLHNSPP